MINSIKRIVSALLAFVLVFTIIFGVTNLQVSAQTVEYVYAEGKYIKNWGIREQTATFLSQNAESFYQKNNTSYSQLASLDGSSDTSAVPSSALYKELQSLMKKNHTFITDYGYTRYKFQYTDCQNSGKTSDKISSFYSGIEIGPKWDSGNTWNREHTWPNSKGDGDGENDIMMLRPTAKSENGARGNKAYGTSGFYDPNMESGGKHDLRGDVARIALYQYVRWGQMRLFGTSGVIESKEVLIEWMEADPVDTWELGRNDSVESITGTRNVFVDYPELAFILFGEQVPADYTSPSGSAKNGITPAPTPDNTQTNQNSTQNNVQSTPQNTTSSSTSCTHTGAYKVEAEDPRCDIEGFTEGKYCPDCKKYISGRKLIEATGHTYAGECDNECDMCGSSREISTEVKHTFGEDNSCIVCGIENPDNNIEINTDITDAAEPQKSGIVWWFIGGGVIIVGSGAALLIIFRKKNMA